MTVAIHIYTCANVPPPSHNSPLIIEQKRVQCLEASPSECHAANMEVAIYSNSPTRENLTFISFSVDCEGENHKGEGVKMVICIIVRGAVDGLVE